jgi:spermidine synthase
MEKKGILSNRIYLYMTSFFAGMSIMAVELGASRLLAPYFSSSQIVWTIIIGTIMIAMALGNIYGGRSADKDPNPDKLYIRILIAAIWIAAIPIVGKYIILLISGLLVITININFLIWAAFFSCAVIFVFPLFLLGTTTPSLVKYTTDNLEDNGRTVGSIIAFNTIGSIIGTFVPTFITIPTVGTSMTFLIFAGILLVLALIYFVSTKVKKRASIVGVVLFVLCLIFSGFDSFAFWEDNLLYEGESIYNYLQVKEDDDRIILSTNVLFGVQSLYMKDGGLTGMYYEHALMGPLMADVMNKDNTEILVLGMGTGTYAKQCQEYFDRVTIEGVEIDEKIVDLSTEYFEFPEDIPVTTYDGRAFLNATDKKYDVILIDAYQDISIPFQMATIEFFQMVEDHLNEDGIVILNMNMHSEEEGNINDYLSDTISNVFDEIYTMNVPRVTNRLLYATNNDAFIEVMNQNIDQLELQISEAETEDQKAHTEALYSLLDSSADRLVAYQAGDYLLTDDKAPVERLGMQVIDILISNELSYYKEILREEGIEGIYN